MIEELQWERKSSGKYIAFEPSVALSYIIRIEGMGVWRARMDNALIGDARGFVSFEAARSYVEWGGTPSRMGYDPETGELLNDNSGVGNGN